MQKTTAASINDFLMNESQESADPKLKSGVASPEDANNIHIYAKTAKRRGPGRPRTRPDVLR